MMGLERVAVLLMCACVATCDVIASTTTEAVSTTEAANFDEFIADWTPTNTSGNDTAHSPQYATDHYLENRLYDYIYDDFYDKAIELSKDIVKQDRSHIIKSFVDYMIKEKKQKVTAYAYKLWEAKGGVVVEKLFPEEFEMVFNDSIVLFTNYRYNSPIELGFRVDDYQDKYVYGNDRNLNGKNYIWKLEPAYVEDNIYFKIRNNVDGRYLKLADHTDRDGDYLAYGSVNADTDRHLWMLQPARHDGVTLFFLVNLKHYQALTLAKHEYGGDRKAFGVDGAFYSHPDQYGWRVRVIKTGGFKVFIA